MGYTCAGRILLENGTFAQKQFRLFKAVSALCTGFIPKRYPVIIFDAVRG
jgi:hypothetical protein